MRHITGRNRQRGGRNGASMLAVAGNDVATFTIDNHVGVRSTRGIEIGTALPFTIGGALDRPESDARFDQSLTGHLRA